MCGRPANTKIQSLTDYYKTFTLAFTNNVGKTAKHVGPDQVNNQFFANSVKYRPWPSSKNQAPMLAPDLMEVVCAPFTIMMPFFAGVIDSTYN